MRERERKSESERASIISSCQPHCRMPQEFMAILSLSRSRGRMGKPSSLLAKVEMPRLPACLPACLPTDDSSPERRCQPGHPSPPSQIRGKATLPRSSPTAAPPPAPANHLIALSPSVTESLAAPSRALTLGTIATKGLSGRMRQVLDKSAAVVSHVHLARPHTNSGGNLCARDASQGSGRGG